MTFLIKEFAQILGLVIGCLISAIIIRLIIKHEIKISQKKRRL